MQKALFPMKSHRISCAWNQGKAHNNCSKGTPHDYPTDLVGKDSGRDWFYAPCDLVVLRRYTKASHAIWMRSLDKVDMPYGKGYLYIMAEHQDNSEMAGPGHVYKQGGKCFREGRNGNATGYHLHVSFGYSKEKKEIGSGWKKNSRGAWVLSIPGVKPIKIHEALYKTFVVDATKKPSKPKLVKKTKKAKPPYKEGATYTLQKELYLRKEPSKTAKKVTYKELTKYAQAKDKDKDAALDKGTKVDVKKVIKTDEEVWFKLSSGYYICAFDGKEVLIK